MRDLILQLSKSSIYSTKPTPVFKSPRMRPITVQA
ncbi:transcriptional regulator, partial [Klebsiella pneumoniae]|nr:transcriptional regulator [Klebsiella pneumoniae]